jgi:hypothetical protein
VQFPNTIAGLIPDNALVLTGLVADFQDLSPRRFHNHSPIVFMIMHPPFSSSFTRRFHDHAPTLGPHFLAVCFLLGNHSTPFITGSCQPSFVALPSERRPNLYFICEGRARPLRAAAEQELYGIGREALINAIRHADARNIAITVVFHRNSLSLTVRDDGCGIEPTLVAAGKNEHLVGVRGSPGSLLLGAQPSPLDEAQQEDKSGYRREGHSPASSLLAS